MNDPALSKQVKILQILPALNAGGVERGTVDLAKYMTNLGISNAVASSGGPMETELLRHHIPHFKMNLKSKNPWIIWRNTKKLMTLAQSQGFTHFHVRSRAPAWSAYWAAKKLGLILITTFHGRYNFKGSIKKIYNSVMTKGQGLIAVSSFIKNHIIESYGIAEDKIKVIHRGVDLSHFDDSQVSRAHIEQAHRELNLPYDQRIILMPGRISRWKGQDLAIRALAEVKDPNTFLLIVGSAKGHETYHQELQDLIHELKLHGRVAIAPHYNFMPALYVIAEIMISASREPEAFGRTVAEAMNFGLMTIAPNHGGACEIINHDINGWLFEPGKADDLARNINFALSLTESAKQQLRVNAINKIHQNFTLDHMAQETIDLYLDIYQQYKRN